MADMTAIKGAWHQVAARCGARGELLIKLLNFRLSIVMPGLVPGIALRDAMCPPKRDGRDKPGHDELQQPHE